MQQVQTDVLELARNLLLENKTAFICSRSCTVSLLQSHTHTHMHTCTHAQGAYLVTHKCSSSSQGLLTDLAYFLEVELWQGMEPVGQLSEVEKFHLKPRGEFQTEVNEEERKEKAGSRDDPECNLGCCHGDRNHVSFCFPDIVTARGRGKKSVMKLGEVQALPSIPGINNASGLK